MPFIFYLLGVAAFAFNTVRPLGVNLSIGDLFFLSALYFLVLEGLRSRRPLREWLPLHSFWLPSFFILIGGLLSSTRAVQPWTSVLITVKTWFVFSLWISLSIVMFRDRNRLRNILIVYIAGVVLTSLIAIWDSGTSMMLGSAIAGETVEGWGRYSGTMGHPNELGNITAVASPIAWGVAWSEESGRFRRPLTVIAGAVLVILMWATILSGSVAALAGFLLAVSLLFTMHLVRNQAVGRIAIPILMPIGLGVAASYLILNWQNIGHLLYGTPLYANLNRALYLTGPLRFSLIQEAWHRIAQNPLMGYGMDQTGTSDLPLSDLVTSLRIHNTLIQSWLAGGLLVFFGVTWIYVVTLRLTLRNLPGLGRVPNNWLVIALCCSVLAGVFMDQWQPNLYQRYKWLAVAALIGISTDIDGRPNGRTASSTRD